MEYYVIYEKESGDYIEGLRHLTDIDKADRWTNFEDAIYATKRILRYEDENLEIHKIEINITEKYDCSKKTWIKERGKE